MARTTKAAAALAPEADTKTMDLLADVAPAAGTALAIVKTPAERAVSALNSTARELELAELVKKSGDIVEVKNADARAQVHRMAMELKNTRCAITKQSEEARSDATAFSKAVLSEERRLIAITNAEEDRLFKLRDDFDKAEADAKAAAERIEAARVASIKAVIADIGALPARLAGAASADLTAALTELANRDLAAESLAEFLGEASVALDTTAAALIALRDGALAREQAEADRIRLQEEEKARIEAQAEANRVEAARLAQEAETARAAQAERDRVAAAEQAERDRVAAETKRQLDEQAAQVAAARQAQELEAAKLQADLAQQQAAMADIRSIQQLGELQGTRQVADAITIIKAMALAAEKFGAMLDLATMTHDMTLVKLEQRLAGYLAVELPVAHAEALEDNARFDIECAPLIEAEPEPMLMGCMTVDGGHTEIDWDALPDTLPLPEGTERDAEINAAPGPTRATDLEIVDLLASEYGMTRSEAIVRLAQIDFKALEEN